MSNENFGYKPLAAAKKEINIFANRIKSVSPEFHTLIKERINTDESSSEKINESRQKLSEVFSVSELAQMSRASAKEHSLLRFLTIIRNASIFLPVLITWYALYDASTFYKKLINNENTSLEITERSFLYLWQNDKLGSLDLGETALLAFLALVLIVVLNAILSFKEDDDGITDGMRIKLLLTRIDNQMIPTTIEETNQALTEFAQASVTLSQNISLERNELDERLEVLGDSIKLINNVLTDVGKTVEQQSTQIGLVISAVSEMTEMGDAVKKMTDSATSISELLTPTVQTLTTTTESVSESHQLIAKTLQDAQLDILGTTTDSMRELGQQLLVASTEMTNHLANSYNEAANRFDNAQSTMENSIIQTSERLAQVASNLERTMMALEGISEKINDAAKDAHFIATEYLDTKND